MTDEEFASAFDACTLEKSEFTHEGHLRLAWLTLRSQKDFASALNLFRTRLQRYAASIGKPGVYHETLTVVWLRLVAHALTENNSVNSFAEFMTRCEWLRDRDNPKKHYSSELLDSISARRSFVEADLRPLPS